MITMDAQLNAADVADLNRAIDLMIRGTKRLGKDAVHRASYAFLVSAKANTPQAKKKLRTLHTEKSTTKFYMIRRQEPKKAMRILLPNVALVKGRERKQEAREVFKNLKAKYKYKPHMKAAKNSWNRAFSGLGKSVAYTMDVMNRRVLAASRAQKLGGTFNPSVRITNDLSYLPKIAPQLEATAMRAAGKKLLHIVERGIEKQVRKF